MGCSQEESAESRIADLGLLQKSYPCYPGGVATKCVETKASINIVLVSWGFHEKKYHVLTGKTTEMYCLIVREVRNLRSKSWQGCSLKTPGKNGFQASHLTSGSFLACGRRTYIFCVCVQISPFCKTVAILG